MKKIFRFQPSVAQSASTPASFPTTVAKVTSLLCCLLFSSATFALVELKGGFSQFTTSPSALNDQFPGNPKISQMQAISFDVMGNVPLMPVGLGVRHEMFSRKESDGALRSEIDWKRTSILVNKRLIDTLMYLGPVATVSFASDFKYSSDSGAITTNYKTESQLTATAGVEAGFKLALLSLGAEVGYLYAPVGELRDAAGVAVTNGSGSKINVDLSGPYMRATVGFGF